MDIGSVNETVIESSEDLNRPRDRAAKLAWQKANYSAPNYRGHTVTSHRGYGPRRSRAADPETGVEPPFNECDCGVWTEEDEDILDAELLTAFECFGRKPCVALMGRR